MGKILTLAAILTLGFTVLKEPETYEVKPKISIKEIISYNFTEDRINRLVEPENKDNSPVEPEDRVKSPVEKLIDKIERYGILSPTAPILFMKVYDEELEKTVQFYYGINRVEEVMGDYLLKKGYYLAVFLDIIGSDLEKKYGGTDIEIVDGGPNGPDGIWDVALTSKLIHGLPDRTSEKDGVKLIEINQDTFLETTQINPDDAEVKPEIDRLYSRAIRNTILPRK